MQSILLQLLQLQFCFSFDTQCSYSDDYPSLRTSSCKRLSSSPCVSLCSLACSHVFIWLCSSCRLKQMEKKHSQMQSEWNTWRIHFQYTLIIVGNNILKNEQCGVYLLSVWRQASRWLCRSWQCALNVVCSISWSCSQTLSGSSWSEWSCSPALATRSFSRPSLFSPSLNSKNPCCRETGDQHLKKSPS